MVDVYKLFRRPMWKKKKELQKLSRQLFAAVDDEEKDRLGKLVAIKEQEVLDASLYAAQHIFAVKNRKKKTRNLEIVIKEGTGSLCMKELVFKSYYLSAVLPVVLIVGKTHSQLVTELLGEDSIDKTEVANQTRIKILFSGFRRLAFAAESDFEIYLLANLMMYPIAMDAEDPEEVDRLVRFGTRPYKRDYVLTPYNKRILAVIDFHGLYGWEAVFFTQFYIYLCSGFSAIRTLLIITGYDDGWSEVQEEVTYFLWNEKMAWKNDPKNPENKGCLFYTFPLERNFDFLWDEYFQYLFRRFPVTR